ncbi:MULTISPECIES: fimbrial protein [Enterobacter]|jgi:type 1 fimbria pilin|uniref:Fimbrial protein n=1 Tax=Enterobacter vonholyi TaxID=2797505 RepID=A0ABU6E469_9ENTR|nr:MULTISPECIES: fimbrial protein [Enterobacter]QBN09266.1 fimbrial protein [Enterobacter cloacae complex sp.]MCM7618098.1 fimbrial protein [Enterobacter vonholyi]MEB6411009.1 fimbrial protein [Enterobacter vonholyi]MEB7625521.1 fimbrial protein [Enterobacter vonholyi]BBJ66361.1 fimbrial-like protein [Enterobacter sp. 18A13]
MTSGQWKGVMILLLVLFISVAHGHDGTVNISGTIQDNTCELAPDSQNKTVDMGVVAASQFRRAGDFSPATHFTLNLQNCGPAASGATVTFSGSADGQDPELFAIAAEADSANGLALGIFDRNGKLIAPGKTSTEVILKAGQASVVMEFSARYVSVQNSVTVGSANAVVTFIVNYL